MADGQVTRRTGPVELQLARKEHIQATVKFLFEPPAIKDDWQRATIQDFGRLLRRNSTFEETWLAAGGASRVAALLATLPVNHVFRLCRALGHHPKQNSQSGRRQTAMTELVAILSESSSSADPRSLRRAYELIVPACDQQTIMQWASSPDGLSHSLERLSLQWGMDNQLYAAHRQRAFDGFFSSSFNAGEAAFLAAVPFIDSDAEFGFSFLAQLGESESLNGAPSRLLIQSLIGPLARRSERQRRDGRRWFYASRFWPLLIQCLKTHAALRYCLEVEPSNQHVSCNILRYGVKGRRLTSVNAQENEKILTSLFKLIPPKLAKKIDPCAITKLVPHSTRYKLLRLYFLHARGFDLGPIDSTDASLLAPKRFDVTIPLFQSLPNHEALALLERFIQSFPDLSFIKGASQRDIITFPRGPEESTDPFYLRASLIRCTPPDKIIFPRDPATVISKLKTEEMESRRTNATRGRTPELRAFWINAALCLATCLGDLDSFQDILLWSRKFNKDPVTVMEVYSSCSFGEAVTMLSVISAPRNSLLCRRTLAEDVQLASKIMLNLLEMATMGLMEPSFNRQSWSSVLYLSAKVARQRIRDIDAFQDRYAMSDSEVIETIWKPTLDVLIKVEKTLLQPAHERLRQPSRQNVFNIGSIATARGPTLQFIDNFAKARNDLWVEIRSKKNTAVLELTDPWPQGLPIQDLLNFSVTGKTAIPNLWDSMPYLDSRIRKIVFGSADVLLAALPENTKAVGDYIEDWSTSMRTFLQGVTEDVKNDRIRAAWEHATGPLSRSRMSIDEAERFWMDKFHNAGARLEGVTFKNPKQEPARARSVLARLPSIQDPETPVTWNPDSVLDHLKLAQKLDGPKPKDRTLPQTCLDILLGTKAKAFSRVSVVPAAPQVKQPNPQFWDYVSLAKEDDEVDAVIAAAMLYINHHEGADETLLKTAYSDSNGPRFPAVILDQAFLKRKDYRVHNALRQFANHSDKVPAKLLNQLLTSILERKKAETDPAKRGCGLISDFTQMLYDSPDPTAGISLLVKFIANFPEASAWHRQLFTIAKLNSATPPLAIKLVEDLSSSLIERIRHSRFALRPDGVTPAANTEGPAVKVTTFKMIAQVLNGTVAVPTEVTCRVLANILEEMDHVDVQIAALDGMVAAVRDTKNAAARDAMTRTIEAGIVRRASALNERLPEREDDWEAAENGGPLPEIWNPSNGEPPMMAWLLKQSARAYNLEKPETKTNEFTLMVSRVIRASSESHQRWTRLFLDKFGFHRQVLDVLPLVPPYYWTVLNSFKLHKDWLNEDIFDAMKHHVLQNLEPDPEVAAITEAVRANPELVRSPVGKHWILLWDNPSVKALPLGAVWAAQRLSSITCHVLNNQHLHSQIEKLEDFVLEVIDTLLRHGDVVAFSRFLDYLDFIHSFDSSYVRHCGAKGTLLQRIIARVERLRTPAWQRDRQRKPDVLPDLCVLQLLQIQQLRSSLEEPEPVEDVMEAFTRISTLIDDMVSTNAPYHSQFDRLKAVVNARKLWLELPLALNLGSQIAEYDTDGVPSLGQYLKVELSASLLTGYRNEYGKMEDWAGEGADDAREMVRQWAGSHVEAYRNAARMFCSLGGDD